MPPFIPKDFWEYFFTFLDLKTLFLFRSLSKESKRRLDNFLLLDTRYPLLEQKLTLQEKIKCRKPFGSTHQDLSFDKSTINTINPLGKSQWLINSKEYTVIGTTKLQFGICTGDGKFYMDFGKKDYPYDYFEKFRGEYPDLTYQCGCENHIREIKIKQVYPIFFYETDSKYYTFLFLPTKIRKEICSQYSSTKTCISINKIFNSFLTPLTDIKHMSFTAFVEKYTNENRFRMLGYNVELADQTYLFNIFRSILRSSHNLLKKEILACE